MLYARSTNSKNSWVSPKFLFGVTPADNVQHVKLMKWMVAILSYATDLFLILVVAKSSNCRSHRNQATNQVLHYLELSEKNKVLLPDLTPVLYPEHR
jgi:hypothetical protein